MPDEEAPKPVGTTESWEGNTKAQLEMQAMAEAPKNVKGYGGDIICGEGEAKGRGGIINSQIILIVITITDLFLPLKHT